MEFDWSAISHERWHALLARAPRANLLQSWPYAVAARAHDQMMSRRGLIIEGGQTIGILQIQEIKIGPVHILKLHRGPLWLEKEVGQELWQDFFAAFAREFPPRFGRWRQLLPELDDSEDARALLQNAGLRRKAPEPYQTIMLDIRPAPDDIRKAFKANWRNKLRQAERAGTSVICDPAGISLRTFLEGYDADKSARGYRGPKPARLATLIGSAAPSGDALILNAKTGKETVAAVLMFRHGCAATYQAGWTSETGRKARAHHLLLWTAINRLRDAGVTSLDLGGIHPFMAAGVTQFKLGLRGQPVTLPGIFG